jgi:hypothetical protein
MSIPWAHFSKKTTEVSHLYVDETGYHEVRVSVPKRVGVLAFSAAVVFAAFEWLFG